VSMAAIQENEIYEILGQTISMGYQYQIRDAANQRATMNKMRSN